jgi:hypothetical protein
MFFIYTFYRYGSLKLLSKIRFFYELSELNVFQIYKYANLCNLGAEKVRIMRIVAEYPSVDFKITVFSWNGKYLLKIEKGMFEQTYKISEMDVTGDDEVKKIVEDATFVEEVKERFKNMNLSLNGALNRIE